MNEADVLTAGARWLHFCGLAVGPGLLWAHADVHRATGARGLDRRIGRWCSVGVVLLVTAEALALTPSGVGGAIGRGEAALAAQRVAMALALWLLLGLAGPNEGAPRRRVRRRGAAGALLVGLAEAALDGWSARSAGLPGAGGWLVAAAGTLHVLAMMGWLGALAWLLLEWPQLAAGAKPVAARRTRCVATWCVGILVASGACLAVAHVPDLATLSRTTYGRTLLAKLGLFGAGLAAAGAGVPAARAGARAPQAWRIEAVCLGMVLAGAALLMKLPAPR